MKLNLKVRLVRVCHPNETIWPLNVILSLASTQACELYRAVAGVRRTQTVVASAMLVLRGGIGDFVTLI